MRSAAPPPRPARKLEGGALLFKAPGRPALEPLIAGGVIGFKVVELKPGLVQLTLELKRRETGAGLASLGPLKVIEDMLIPCIAGRDRALPWRPVFEDRR